MLRTGGLRPSARVEGGAIFNRRSILAVPEVGEASISKKGGSVIEKLLSWLHRKTVISGKSCIRRGCNEFHGISPSLHATWANVKYIEELKKHV
ncbi:hypothetical protein ABID29_001819 [Streptococcus rupicaprae]|uniref:Uncharacterized protein n=1 Tax=Streptococcus rupicaprae TaxID=759619 RepID=A0ABV2FJI9_9STRE